MEYVQRELPYVRSFVLRSVYGVLRPEKPHGRRLLICRWAA